VNVEAGTALGLVVVGGLDILSAEGDEGRVGLGLAFAGERDWEVEGEEAETRSSGRASERPSIAFACSIEAIGCSMAI